MTSFFCLFTVHALEEFHPNACNIKVNAAFLEAEDQVMIATLHQPRLLY